MTDQNLIATIATSLDLQYQNELLNEDATLIIEERKKLISENSEQIKNIDDFYNKINNYLRVNGSKLISGNNNQLKRYYLAKALEKELKNQDIELNTNPKTIKEKSYNEYDDMEKIATITAYVTNLSIDDYEKTVSNLNYIKELDEKFKSNPELITSDIEKKANLFLRNKNSYSNNSIILNDFLEQTKNDYNIVFNRNIDFILGNNPLYSKIEFKEENDVQEKENKKLLKLSEKLDKKQKEIKEKEKNLKINFEQLNMHSKLLDQREKELDKKEKRINYIIQFYSNMTKQLDEYAKVNADFKKKYTFTLMFGGLTPKQFETVCDSTMRMADKFRAKNEKQRQKENQRINENTKHRGRK